MVVVMIVMGVVQAVVVDGMMGSVYGSLVLVRRASHSMGCLDTVPLHVVLQRVGGHQKGNKPQLVLIILCARTLG